MLVCLAVEPSQGLSHHVEFRLAIPLEDAGIALAEHQCDEVVCHASGTEARSERVTQLV